MALLDISFNLLPTSVDLGALGAVPTDGAQLLALLLGARRWREGYDLLAALANKPDGDPLLANNAAFAAVTSFNHDLLTDADRLSTIAFAQMPTVPTRAAVLIELGRPADALPLLKVALRSQLRAPDRAIVLGFSAIAHHDLGDERAAAKQRRAMVHFDASCPLDDEVKRRLALPPGQASRSASPQWSAPTAGTATH